MQIPRKGKIVARWRGVHKDWRLWVVVGLMLLAMLTYVMTMDEAVRPGGRCRRPSQQPPETPMKCPDAHLPCAQGR